MIAIASAKQALRERMVPAAADKDGDHVRWVGEGWLFGILGAMLEMRAMLAERFEKDDGLRVSETQSHFPCKRRVAGG